MNSSPRSHFRGRRLLGASLLCSIAVSSTLRTVGQETVASAPNPAVVPSDRLSEPWWAARHKAVLEAARQHPDTQLLLIGDSITNNYDKADLPDENFQPTWKQFYEPRKALNLGFSGDTTAHLLWRLDHGEVDGLHPKAVVLLIGTNNTGHHNQSAEETEIGIDAVIADLEDRLPETNILLLGILPSEISDSKSERDRAINQYLAICYGENPRISYLDIGSIFYKSGALNAALFYDPRLPQHGKPLHPDTNGQRMMAEAIEPTLAKLMGDEPRVVLMGDSITHFWDGPPRSSEVNGPTAWQRVFGIKPVLNMGFGWDRTQNVLWRLRQGEFDDLHPEWVVLMIGTNNLTGTDHARANTPEEIVDGIDAIYQEIRRRSPESRILVIAILPRGQKPNDPLRAPIQATNRRLAERFAANTSVTYVDIGAAFLAP